MGKIHVNNITPVGKRSWYVAYTSTDSICKRLAVFTNTKAEAMRYARQIATNPCNKSIWVDWCDNDATDTEIGRDVTATDMRT